jgi:hypothetical protein
LDTTGLELLLEIEIEGLRHLVLVDSGASLSVMKPGIGSSELRPTQTAVKGVTGNKLKTAGTQIITFRVGSSTYTHEFLIAPLDVDYSGILGVDILERMEATVDLRTSTLVLGRTSHRLSGREAERCALINSQPQAEGSIGDGPDHPETDRTHSFSGNTHPRVEPGRIRHPWLGRGGLRAGRPSSTVSGNSCGKNEGHEQLRCSRGSIGGTRRNRNAGGIRGSSCEPGLYSGGADTLGDLEERSERKTGTRRDKYNGEVYVNDVSKQRRQVLCS